MEGQATCGKDDMIVYPIPLPLLELNPKVPQLGSGTG